MDTLQNSVGAAALLWYVKIVNILTCVSAMSWYLIINIIIILLFVIFMGKKKKKALSMQILQMSM